MPLFQPPVHVNTLVMTQPGITIYYPSVVDLNNRYAEAQINQTIYNTVQLLQQEQLKVQTGTNLEMIGQFEVKTNERGILSLILTNYAYSVPMAHGFTVAKALTFDIQTGRLFSLADLFKPGADYVSAISAQVAQQIEQRDIPLINEFQSIRPDQDFYLADKVLVIFFSLYEMTPYYVGFPMFPISVYDLLSIAAEGGPIDRLAASIA